MTDDFPCCSLPPARPPVDYARIAVLQTERETLRRQMEREGARNSDNSPLAHRYWAIHNEIKEGIGK